MTNNHVMQMFIDDPMLLIIMILTIILVIVLIIILMMRIKKKRKILYNVQHKNRETIESQKNIELKSVFCEVENEKQEEIDQVIGNVESVVINEEVLNSNEIKTNLLIELEVINGEIKNLEFAEETIREIKTEILLHQLYNLKQKILNYKQKNRM